MAKYKAGTCFILLPRATLRRSLYFWVSAHFQKHFIRIGEGQSLFNQAVLNKNAMIRRYCQRGWMGLRARFYLFWCFKVRSTLARFTGIYLNRLPFSDKQATGPCSNRNERNKVSAIDGHAV